MALQNFLTCPADCDTDLNLPGIPDEQDCTSYPQFDAQVCDLIIVPAPASDPLVWTDPTAPTILGGGINNTATDNSAAKRIVGEGEVPEPETEIAEYPKNKTKVVKRMYTINQTIKQMDDDTYELLRALQCGWTGFTFYYGNLAGNGFGPVGGISPTSISVVMPLSGGRGEKQFGRISITWEADGDPPRWASPWA